MKISPKKKGEIYDLVHVEINDAIRNVEEYWNQSDFHRNNIHRIHFLIGQVEIPLAQKIIKLLQGKQRSNTMSKEKKLKEFTIVNDQDPNDTFTVEAVDGNDAAFKALDNLGWWVSEGEEIEEERKCFGVQENSLTDEEEGTILELARVALSDAEVYDYFAEKLDLSDAELKALQKKIESITNRA